MTETSSPLEWPRFCYSFDGSHPAATSPTKPAMKRRRRTSTSPGGRGAVSAFTPTKKRPASAAFQVPAPPPPPLKRSRTFEPRVLTASDHAAGFADLTDLTYSTLMRRMAEKYQGSDDGEKENIFPTATSRENLQAVSYLLPYLNPLLHQQLFLQQQQQQQQQQQPDHSSPTPTIPLDLSQSSPSSSSSSTSSCSDWGVEEVCKFVAAIDECQDYEQAFRDHAIDGAALSVLAESHLTGILGLRLGPAIRIIRAIREML